jgi:hypothetical protein
LLIFYWLPLGGDGWGGRGSGGGLGDAKGAGKGSPGLTSDSGTQTGTGVGKDTAATAQAPAPKRQMVVELLGGPSVEGDKYYRVDGNEPPVNWATLKATMEAQKASVANIKIVITGHSISRYDPQVTVVEQTAAELEIPVLGPAKKGM